MSHPSRIAMQMVFGRRATCVVPKATLFSSRLGMTNKYAYDYACEDEFFEREMTRLDAKITHLPMTNKHKELPMHDYMPPHWNDVRFNFIPDNMDRRCYIHDNMAIYYNMEHGDYQ